MDPPAPPSMPELSRAENTLSQPLIPNDGLFFVASDLDVESEALSRAGRGYFRWSCAGEPEEEEQAENDDEDASDAFDEYLDLEELQFLSVEGVDKQGRKILRIIGKFFPATVIDSTRLKKYVLQKISRDIAEEPYCIVYFHTLVKRKDNSPGVLTLRWIYESLPQKLRELLKIVYFVHPGILSRTFMATLGRFLLSDGLYNKLYYINRIEFLWDHLRKTQLEVPEFVYEHDEELEHRPLMDYGLEADPLHTYGPQGFDAAFARNPSRWMS